MCSVKVTQVKDRLSQHQELPSHWLTPGLHSVYLHAMINFAESRDDCGIFNRRNTDFRPGLHTYLQTYNLLKELRFPTDPVAGFEFGLSVPPAAHGAMGQAAVSSSNVADAFATIAQYTPMRNNLVQYDWFEQAEVGTLTIEPLFDMDEYSDMILAATIATFVQMVVFLVGSRSVSGLTVKAPWQIQHQTLSREDLIPGIEFRYVRGGQSAAIVVPAQVLSHRNATRDAVQYRQACESCRSELAALQGSCAAQVTSYLQSMECSQWPKLNGVATHLAMSRRTLIRKLKAEGTSYQALTDEIKGKLACWRLENTHVPIGDLAFSLGFADESNFSRSFRRWRGMTPSQYRGLFNGQDQVRGGMQELS